MINELQLRQIVRENRVRILMKHISSDFTYVPTEVIMQRKERYLYLTWRSECLGRSDVSVFDGVVTPCGESGRGGTCNHS
jgi:hypothetical protein